MRPGEQNVTDYILPTTAQNLTKLSPEIPTGYTQAAGTQAAGTQAADTQAADTQAAGTQVTDPKPKTANK